MATMNQKQLKREMLLDYGVQLLMDQGYHGTGLKQILEQVKIPKGSFYNYFGSKEAFAAEAIHHYIEPFISRLQQHLQDPSLSGLQALQAYYQGLINEIEQSDYKGGCLLGNLMGEIGDTSDLCRQALKSSVTRYHALQQQALVRAQTEGLVRKDYSAEDMANLLLNGWQGALLRMKIERSTQPLKECINTLLNDCFQEKQ